MEFVKRNGVAVAVLDRSERLDSVQAALDAMADARCLGGCDAMAAWSECFGDDFFDLKTGFAGDVLQKFSNYRFRVAIVGDFSRYSSNALRDFIYECNQGTHVRFRGSMEQALDVLAGHV